MSNKELSYSQAIAKIEEIVETMNKNEMDIDQLGKQVEHAVELISLCKSKLHKAQSQVDAALKKEED